MQIAFARGGNAIVVELGDPQDSFDFRCGKQFNDSALSWWASTSFCAAR